MLILLSCFIENSHEASPGEIVNEAVTRDDGTYYNTKELNTTIRVDALQRVISEKSTGKNKVFQSEYKVIGKTYFTQNNYYV